MAQIRKAEGQVEVKCSADKLFHAWARNTPQVSKMCPDKFPKIELLEGNNCHTLGSILSWTYVTPVDGTHEYVKTVLEEIDEKNRSFTYNLIEGNIMNTYYKTWKEKVEFTPKGENCSIAKWSVIEYEKKCEDAPDPALYIDFLLESIKDTVPHLSSA